MTRFTDLNVDFFAGCFDDFTARSTIAHPLVLNLYF